MTDGRNDMAYELRHWTAPDGLKLAFRDYPGRADRPPILCLPGLTRNARDFEGVADRLAGEWRVLAVDFRGRGKSDFAKDSATYLPVNYAADIETLLAAEGIERFIAFGTSLGGIVAMILASRDPSRIAGALLNDVGPELDPAGLTRIRSYVGRGAAMPTWMHAARAVAESNAHVYPDYSNADWLAMAKRLYRLNSSGRVVLDYDMRIAEPFRTPGNEAAPDMWGGFDALTQRPLLVVRGERSDVLGAETARKMAEKGAELVTVPRTGHTPTLTEPTAVAAVDRLLARVEQARR